jgi:hypothetical protein
MALLVIRRVLAITLLALLLTSCGALNRSGGTPIPGPTLSPTGSPFRHRDPGRTGDGEGAEQTATTATEEPDFPG